MSAESHKTQEIRRTELSAGWVTRGNSQGTITLPEGSRKENREDIQRSRSREGYYTQPFDETLPEQWRIIGRRRGVG